MAQWFINHVAETAILSSSSKLRFGFFDSGKKEKQREKVTGKNREIEPIPPLHFHYFSGIKIGWIPLSTSTGSDAVQARREIKNPPKKKGSSAGMKPNCVDCYTKYFPLQLLHSQQLRFSAPPPPCPPSIHLGVCGFLEGRRGGIFLWIFFARYAASNQRTGNQTEPFGKMNDTIRPLLRQRIAFGIGWINARLLFLIWKRQPDWQSMKIEMNYRWHLLAVKLALRPAEGK